MTDSYQPDKWRWALRDSGLLKVMKQSEVAVIFYLYCLADSNGEMDFPVDFVAEQLGYTPRAVREAREVLRDERRLIERVGGSDHNHRAKRFRLVSINPVPQETEVQFHKERSHTSTLSGSAVPNGSTFPCKWKHTSLKTEAHFPQRSEEETKSSGSSGAQQPVYDHTAAAALVGFGVPRRVAHGIISRYRPTNEQVGVVLENIKAKNDEAARGNGSPVKSVEAFVLAAIKRGEFELDSRAIRRRELIAKAQEAKDRKSSADADRAAKAEREQAEQARLREAADEWARMSDAERRAVFDEYQAKIKIKVRQDDPITERACIALLAKRTEATV